ncbi:MAG: arginine repressor [Acidobacteriota bacterium]
MSRRKSGARALLLRRLLAEQPIDSQDRLVDLLAERGHQVTQATVSRDLAALGALKILDDEGLERYVVPPVGADPGDEAITLLARRLREFVHTIDHSANNLVLKTEVGSAGPVAAALDAAALDDVLGTVGGDDTILVVTRAPDGAAPLARRLRELLETTR